MDRGNEFHIKFKTKVRRLKYWSERIVHFDNSILTYFKTEKSIKPRKKLNLQKHYCLLVKSKNGPSQLIIRDRSKFVIVKIIIPTEEIEREIVNNLNRYIPEPVEVVADGQVRQKRGSIKRESLSPVKDRMMRSSVGGTITGDERAVKLLGKVLGDDLLSSDDEDEGNPEPSTSSVVQEYSSVRNYLDESKILTDIDTGGFYFYQIKPENTLSLRTVLRFEEIIEIVVTLYRNNPLQLGLTSLAIFTTSAILFSFFKTLVVSVLISFYLWTVSFTIINSFGNYPFYIQKNIDLRINESCIVEGCLSNIEELSDEINDDKHVNDIIQMSSISISKFFCIYKSLFIHILKGKLRSEVFPMIRKVALDKDGIMVQKESGVKEFFDQKLINKGKDQLVLVEIDRREKSIRRIYELELLRESKSIRFGVFKSKGDKDTTKIELVGLIDTMKRLSKSLSVIKMAIGKAFYERIEYMPEKLNSLNVDIQFTEPASLSRSMNNQFSPTLKRRSLRPSNGLLSTRDGRILPDSLLKQVSVHSNSHMSKSSRDDKMIKESLSDVKSETGDDLLSKLPENLAKEFLLKKQQAYGYFDLETNPKYEKMTEKGFFKVHSYFEDSFLCSRAEDVINFPLGEIIALFKQYEKRPEYDPAVRKVEVLDRICEGVVILRAIFKGKFTVSDREMILYTISSMVDEDTFVVMMFSPKDREFEQEKRTVRGETEFALIELKRFGPSKTKFKTTQKADIKLRSAPKTMLQNGNLKAQMLPRNIEAYLKKNK